MTGKFKKVAVFCGASSGSGDAYLACAKALGEELVRRKIGLVYGGAHAACLMGSE
jgi:predicted Rossmann-fold nucleotide-binding protein